MRAMDAILRSFRSDSWLDFCELQILLMSYCAKGHYLIDLKDIQQFKQSIISLQLLFNITITMDESQKAS